MDEGEVGGEMYVEGDVGGDGVGGGLGGGVGQEYDIVPNPEPPEMTGTLGNAQTLMPLATYTFCPTCADRTRSQQSTRLAIQIWSSNGAMFEVSRKVQKASTHTSCVAMDVAARHGHNAAIDEDATTLHPEKETSIHRGDG